MPQGTHTIELSVTDAAGDASTDTVVISIVDPLLAECQASVGALTAQIAVLQGQVAALQSGLGAANTLNGQLTAQVTALQSQIQSLNDSIAGLTAQVAALQLDLVGAANTIATLNAQIADLTAQNATLTAQNAALIAQIAPLQASLNQLVAPGPQIASAIVDVGALIPFAPTNTARTRLESARTSLTKSGVNIAAADLIMGLNQTKTAVSQLSSAPLAGMNTAPIRQSLAEGVHMRLLRTFADVTTLVGSSHANVIAANGFLATGEAAHAAGDYLTAIEQYILAFKQLAQI